MTKNDSTAQRIEAVNLTETPAYISLTVDPKLFDLDVITRACYDLSRDFHIWLTEVNGLIQVDITATSSELILDDIQGKFGNLLIDHRLRKQIITQTSHIRDQLVMAALAHAVPKA